MWSGQKMPSKFEVQILDGEWRWGKNVLYALSCSLKFIFWDSLRWGFGLHGVELDRWIDTERDPSPVQYSCMVPIGREIPWPEWQTFIWKTTQAPLRTSECLRISLD